MPDETTIAGQQHPLASQHSETLAIFLQQRAFLGSGHAPPGVFHGINEACTNAVEDLPNDDAPAIPPPSLPHQNPQLRL